MVQDRGKPGGVHGDGLLLLDKSTGEKNNADGNNKMLNKVKAGLEIITVSAILAAGAVIIWNHI